MTVHSLYKERYAYRDDMTDVVVHNLMTNDKVRIKCRDYVKKVAVYDQLLAVRWSRSKLVVSNSISIQQIQLPERVLLYRLKSDQADDTVNYQVIEKINIAIQCSLLVVCSSCLILCHEKKLQSISFTGQTEREWLFDSNIRYIKMTGGVAKQECLMVGLKNGQIMMVFLSSLLPILMFKLANSIRCIDLSLKRRQVAIIDDKNVCHVYDVHSKKLLFQVSPSISRF